MAVTDPIYPVYIDSNVMGGRAGVFENGRWSNVTYMSCNEENKFVPQIPDHRVDMVYLCYPNNPTGMAITKDELQKWVDYALAHNAIIFYDAAYEAYIQDDDIPHTIYEIPNAKKVAIEFHSYISQRAAEAIYSPEGKKQIKQTIDYYMENARILRKSLTELGLTVYGGENAPYLWVKTPADAPSWKFFEDMLNGAQVVCTPGVGFGLAGEGFIRITSFGDRNDCVEAMARIKKWLNK